MKLKPRISSSAALLAMLLLSACSGGSPKSHYILAEKLWSDGKYAASVLEFEKVVSKDPRGKLGLRALLRAAETQAMFLSQYTDAIRNYEAYDKAAPETPEAWDAEKEIGDIYFSKTEQYDRAVQYYQKLLTEKPDAPEAPEFEFRIAKSQFFLWNFDDAVQGYETILKKFPQSPYAEKASFELGVTAFTRGEQKPGANGVGKGAYQQAVEAYQAFLRRYPESTLVPEAKFGIASCLEELDQLDAAYQAYEALRPTYPSPKVIDIKLARIRERKAQRSH